MTTPAAPPNPDSTSGGRFSWDDEDIALMLAAAESGALRPPEPQPR